MPLSTISSISTSSTSSHFSDGLPFPRNQSSPDFEVETSLSKAPLAPSQARRRRTSDKDAEAVYRSSVSALVTAKTRPFTVCGRIPVDPTALILFFRSKSGITHALDFPIDVDYDMPPSFDVLISTCLSYPPPAPSSFPETGALFYPPNLALTATLEIANHPILDAVRNTLFPALPTGHYLTAVRDRLEICLKGSSRSVQPRPSDNRVATIVVTLPVRFRGGGLVVHNKDGRAETFYGRGGKSGDMEWVAFMSDCDYEVEMVQKGCRVTISYAVHLKTFGPSGLQPNPLISPSDQFLDLLSPVLNMSRGRKIAFYLNGEYGVDPSEVLAESLVPYLKGGDSVLYHALKLYKLSPELRWTAGGYVWPVGQTVEILNEVLDSPPISPSKRMAFSLLNGTGMRHVPSVSVPLSAPSEPGSDEGEDLKTRVEKSGAKPLADEEIMLLSDATLSGPVTKERVPFVSGGELEKLVVNVLLIVYIP
ncbi:hypothetical protein CERSUDRAFT_155368 [Gelatoporia subvermispora B]|uniref:Uncharacterized protein n=1 Tax=Ceriporiopsis subvermispora (strain B) TaxID=914234 RepID=M2REV6_CERS8|nr:hypothetical protein CERSUDRAFT_155368 [Gelatoporia subvermispora B]